MNKTNIFMHCLYVTLEEEKKKKCFFFIVAVSEYKNIDKLSFGEHGLFVLNCFSRYVALQ